MKHRTVLASALGLCTAVAIGYMWSVLDGGSAATEQGAVDAGGTVAATHARPHHAERRGLITAPITLNYQLPSSLRVGETAVAVLELQSRHTAGRMEVRANLPAGLSTPGVASQVFHYSATQPVHRWELPIHATRTGNLHFGVIAQEYDADGQAMLARAFAVPVVVGDEAANRAAFKAKQASTSYLRRDPDGRLFMELPASPPPSR